MRRPGIKTRKKKRYYRSYNCERKYCTKCANKWCDIRKPNSELKGYNPPKVKPTSIIEEVVKAKEEKRKKRENLLIKIKAIIYIILCIFSVFLCLYILALRY